MDKGINLWIATGSGVVGLGRIRKVVVGTIGNWIGTIDNCIADIGATEYGKFTVVATGTWRIK